MQSLFNFKCLRIYVYLFAVTITHISLEWRTHRAGERNLPVNCFWYKHKDLSSYQVKAGCADMHPSAGVVKAEHSWDLLASQSSGTGELQIQQNTWRQLLAFTRMRVCAYGSSVSVTPQTPGDPDPSEKLCLRKRHRSLRSDTLGWRLACMGTHPYWEIIKICKTLHINKECLNA